MKFEIKHRWNNEIIFSIETESWKLAVEAAIKSKANLSNANLSKANLSNANLSWADLSEANLSNANLSKANLSKANLSKANLSKADLSEANLSWANLSWANLSKADLSEADLSKANLSKANLSWANLSWANLSKADLSEANLSAIKHDFWSVLLHAKAEISFLKTALTDGKVDGSTYTGECACLVGTIANARKCNVDYVDGIPKDSSRPAERFFMGIKKGDTPKNNPCSKLALQWAEELEGLLKA